MSSKYFLKDGGVMETFQFREVQRTMRIVASKGNF
jgi:hypothetical protein